MTEVIKEKKYSRTRNKEKLSCGVLSKTEKDPRQEGMTVF